MLFVVADVNIFTKLFPELSSVRVAEVGGGPNLNQVTIHSEPSSDK
jgi:hypothetical protein